MKRKYELDDDTIECPICCKPLFPPVHQCSNGHIACSDCCQKLIGNKCPSCGIKRPYKRCYAVEKIIESLLVSCQYAAQGCEAMVKFTQKEDHEKELCEHRPFQCPVSGCEFYGAKREIPEHFGERHVENHQIVQLGPVNRTVKFTMESLDTPYVLVTADDELLLVHYLEDAAVTFQRHDIVGDLFFCTSFRCNSKTYNLKVSEVYGRVFIFHHGDSSLGQSIRR